MPPDGHVFISYSRQDGNEPATKLEQALRAEQFGVWRDVRNLRPEQDFTADIEAAIEAATYVVACITKDAKRNNSFVRREIQYALAVNKPVIPLRFEDIPPHVSIVNNEWLDFYKGWDAAFARLIAILSGTGYTNQPGDEASDPFKPYLQYLLQRVTAYLKQAVIRKIDLSAEATPEAVPEMRVERSMLDLLFDGLPIGNGQKKETPFKTFNEGFQHYNGRVLLLGEPGAGKTITLMAHTRDATAARLDNPTLPLPLLGLIATWDAKEQPPLAHWLAGAYSGLLNETDVQTEIEAGKTIFLFDGLDELGNIREDEITKEKYDPRLRFVQTLASNSTLITCRIKDYEELGIKIPLNGAITLKPLDDAQMQVYLQDYGDLWGLLQTDEQLREVARTPLLLSYFAFAVQDMSEAERAELTNLKDAGDIRDKIFEFYVSRRYRHEEVKYTARGEQIPLTLVEIYEVLGLVAMDSLRWVYTHIEDEKPEQKEWGTVITSGNFPDFIDGNQIEMLLKFLTTVQILMPSGQTEDLHLTFGFTHLLLRDYFIYSFALRHFQDIDSKIREKAVTSLGFLNDIRVAELLLQTLSDEDSSVRASAVEALQIFDDDRVIHALIYCLLNDYDSGVRDGVAVSLMELGDSRAVEPLIQVLLNDVEVRPGAAYALGNLKDSRAIKPLKESLKDSNPDVRGMAAEALGKLEAIDAIEPLAALLADREEMDGEVICYIAAEALDKIGTVEALNYTSEWRTEELKWLKSLVNDPDPDVRGATTFDLGALKAEKGVALLIELLNDKAETTEQKMRVCDYAAKSLEHIGTLEALEAVIQHLEQEIREKQLEQQAQKL